MNPPHDDVAAVAHINDAYKKIKDQVSRVIVGQDAVIEEILIALFAGGHCLLVGAPGLAKTLLVSTVAESLTLQFKRIQFTPDLMPSDILGTEVIQENKSTGDRTLRFLPGPIFGNVILADEINRTPPKTQAALLEAMQERQVTAGGEMRSLPSPFFVLATQNPIEQEGTYPLPEAQLDRFMFCISIDYPSEREELDIVKRTTADESPQVESVLAGDDLSLLAQVVRRVPIADHVAGLAVKLARMSRPQDSNAPECVKTFVTWGAGPRASQNIVLAAKARAVLKGRYCVDAEDIHAVSHSVLRHRVRTNFNARSEGVDSDSIISQLLSELPSIDSESYDAPIAKVFRSARTS